MTPFSLNCVISLVFRAKKNAQSFTSCSWGCYRDEQWLLQESQSLVSLAIFESRHQDCDPESFDSRLKIWKFQFQSRYQDWASETIDFSLDIKTHISTSWFQSQFQVELLKFNICAATWIHDRRLWTGGGIFMWRRGWLIPVQGCLQCT